jgi:hypothetical protein
MIELGACGNWYAVYVKWLGKQHYRSNQSHYIRLNTYHIVVAGNG